MQNVNFENAKNHGFLIIPKALLQQQINNPDHQEGEIEALLKILMKVNYSDTLFNDRWNKDFPCKRGESMYSYRDWSYVLHWSVGKTFRFIHQLEANHIIRIIPHPNNTSLHIQVLDYDLWVGPSEACKSSRKAVNELFHTFWDAFHEMTRQPKKNIAKAQREWKKLSDKEQHLAIDRIEDYYFNLTDTRYILHACNYLSNKAFLNEYR